MTNSNNVLPQENHTVLISNREKMSITGVLDVPSFDENSVVLVTSLGYMIIEGAELKISALDTSGGQVVLSGKINGLFYEDRQKEKPVKHGLGKLFG